MILRRRSNRTWRHCSASALRRKPSHW
uniref:Uncharacterized protein n=1 Tax=Arundo donax TaxID=35708 RepID=A0A0A9GBP3_ARUDO